MSKAQDQIEKGLDLWEDPEHRVTRLKEEMMRRLFPESPPEDLRATRDLEDYFGLFPTSYFVGKDIETLERHMTIIQRLSAETIVTEMTEHEELPGHSRLLPGYAGPPLPNLRRDVPLWPGYSQGGDQFEA